MNSFSGSLHIKENRKEEREKKKKLHRTAKAQHRGRGI